MTNSEAIAGLEAIKKQAGYLTDATDDPVLVLNMGIQALKEAEPRVLSFDEAHGAVDPVMLEIKTSTCLWWVDIVLMEGEVIGAAQSAIRNLYDENSRIYGRVPEEYGKTWRCWNKRPTDEQRKAVAWG